MHASGASLQIIVRGRSQPDPPGCACLSLGGNILEGYLGPLDRAACRADWLPAGIQPVFLPLGSRDHERSQQRGQSGVQLTLLLSPFPLCVASWQAMGAEDQEQEALRRSEQSVVAVRAGTVLAGDGGRSS